MLFNIEDSWVSKKKKAKKVKETKEIIKTKRGYKINIIFLSLKVISVGFFIGFIPGVNSIYNFSYPGRLAA